LQNQKLQSQATNCDANMSQRGSFFILAKKFRI